MTKKQLLLLIDELSQLDILQQGFSVLLQRLKMTYAEWEKLCLSPEARDRVFVRVVTLYKEWHETQLELLLLSQPKGRYNYQLVKWLLASSNPAKYNPAAAKRVSNEKKDTRDTIAGFSWEDDLKNESGINFGKESQN